MSARPKRDRVSAVIGTALFHSPWVARLGRISFLGTLDDHPRSRRATTRLEHSIGVAALGVQASEALDLDRNSARRFVAACLLHDIGHYPLSHAAEPAFTRVLGADHHELSRWIILGAGPIDEARSLRPTLERLDIDPAGVWSLIDGSVTHKDAVPGELALGELLRARINLDTLEGIARVARCFRVRKKIMPSRIFVRDGADLAIDPAAVEAIDQFWGLKDRVYDEVINLPSNILAEARLCELVASEIGDGVFASLEQFDDGALARSLGPRFDEVRLRAGDDANYVLSNHGGPGQVLVRTRKRYFIDARAAGDEPMRPLSFRRWRERYRHEKVRSFLISRHRQLELPGLALAEPPTFAAPEI